MPAGESYEYAVIRVVPRVDRQEFINAGVILYCRKTGYLDAAVHLDEARLRALFSGVDVEAVKSHLHAMCRICCGEQGAGPIAGLTARERFNWLTSPRSALIQASEVHAGLSHDPAATLENLMDRVVRQAPDPHWQPELT